MFGSFEAVRVYGSPGFERPLVNGQFVSIQSAFAGDKKDRYFTKGGVVLVQLQLRDSADPNASMAFT